MTDATTALEATDSKSLASPDVSPQGPPSELIPPLLCLLLLLVVATPIFACKPLTNDAILYDLQADIVRHGGVLYRELLEPNLPGVIWIHLFVRSLFGPSSEAFRLFDLALFLGTATLAAVWAYRATRNVAVSGWLGFAFVVAYVSVSEWCHCQRDIWLLLPTLAALELRRRDFSSRLSNETVSTGQIVRRGLLEGIIWGAAFWIKPYVAVGAIAAWMAGEATLRCGRFKHGLLSVVSILFGGALVGCAGILWLVQTGAWPYFLQTMTDWNPEYFAGRLQGWTTLRFAKTVYHLVPWYLIHLFALPIAIAILVVNVGLRKNLAGGNRQSPPDRSPLRLAEPLMAGLYLGWVFQSFAFQHLFDYVQFPGVLLGFSVVAVPISSLWQIRQVRLSVLTFGLLICMFSLPRQYTNTGLWQTCLRNGTSPEVRAELALILNPDWRKLAEVADFLRTQDLSDGELTCYTSDLVWVYDTLELRPSTRFAYLWEILVYLPEHRPEIYEAVANSPQKLFVFDESGEKLPRPLSRLLGDEVFRAGPYIVYRVVPPQG